MPLPAFITQSPKAEGPEVEEEETQTPWRLAVPWQMVCIGCPEVMLTTY